MSKKHDIIESWLQFSSVESRSINTFINWCAYHYEVPKSYVRGILQDYNTQAEIEKREKEKEQIKEYEDFIEKLKEEME